MSTIIVLGAGMVGSAIARDLSADHKVTAADVNAESLSTLHQKADVETIESDLSIAENITSLIAPFDLVISAVPGFMGYQTLETIIKAGKNVVDISFFNEDPFDLDELAKEQNVTAIMDCGVAPGMSNMFLGYYDEQMDVQAFECMVGGLPMKRSWPYEYKAPFSPIDILEEYTRPARLVENGKIVERPALSEPELVDIDPVGTLEAFNTDGLRSLLKTIDVPNMKEKTLRYPGHIELMKIFRETGFFRKDEIEVNGSSIRPIDLTTKLLFPEWKLGDKEDEFTVMTIKISGKQNGTDQVHEYKLYDRYDPEQGISSMARTTGFTCTAAANLVLEGHYQRTGISPPEYVAEQENCFQFILDYLEDRNVIYQKQ